MVQTIEMPESALEQSPAPEPLRRPYDLEGDFSYHPVPVLAAAGLVVSLISSIAIFVWLALPLCLVGFLLSTLGLWMIRRSKGAYGGTKVAISGMVFAMLFFVGGIAFQIYAFQTEVPEGYQRKSFVADIADKLPLPKGLSFEIHPDVAALDGQRVFIKGYIYQTERVHNLQEFLFVKDNQSCCFGANPAITDRIGVVMKDGEGIDYVAGKVAVAGTFRINKNFTGAAGMEPLYILDADIFTSRVSDF